MKAAVLRRKHNATVQVHPSLVAKRKVTSGLEPHSATRFPDMGSSCCKPCCDCFGDDELTYPTNKRTRVGPAGDSVKMGRLDSKGKSGNGYSRSSREEMEARALEEGLAGAVKEGDTSSEEEHRSQHNMLGNNLTSTARSAGAPYASRGSAKGTGRSTSHHLTASSASSSQSQAQSHAQSFGQRKQPAAELAGVTTSEVISLPSLYEQQSLASDNEVRADLQALGWKQFTSSSGKPFYHSVLTGQSVWQRPPGFRDISQYVLAVVVQVIYWYCCSNPSLVAQCIFPSPFTFTLSRPNLLLHTPLHLPPPPPSPPKPHQLTSYYPTLHVTEVCASYVRTSATWQTPCAYAPGWVCGLSSTEPARARGYTKGSPKATRYTGSRWRAVRPAWRTACSFSRCSLLSSRCIPYRSSKPLASAGSSSWRALLTGGR